MTRKKAEGSIICIAGAFENCNLATFGDAGRGYGGVHRRNSLRLQHPSQGSPSLGFPADQAERGSAGRATCSGQPEISECRFDDFVIQHVEEEESIGASELGRGYWMGKKYHIH
ncbi:hypothetical protein U1Q18_030934 [Sarracenia purpurea var. burkii]